MKPNGWAFLALVALTLFIIFQVVIPQLVLIESWGVFLAIWLGLLTLSFWSSATESALSVISHDATMVTQASQEHVKLINKNFELLKKIENRQVASKRDLLKLFYFRRKNNALLFKRFSISSEGRGVLVGTFAAASVFLNVALAAFLPLAISQSRMTDIVFVWYPVIEMTSESLTWDWRSLDLTGNELFNFVMVSFPLLLFGKIIPKHVGMKSYEIFAYRLNSIVRSTFVILGWVAAGVLWPIELISPTSK